MESGPEAGTAYALDTNPLTGKRDAELAIAIRHIAAGRHDDAIRSLTHLSRNLAYRHKRRNVYVLHELALAHRLKGQPEQAVALLSPYKDQLWPDSLAALGSALDELGYTAEAKAVLRWGVAKYPRSGLLYSELGTTFRRQGRIQAALGAYERGIIAEPGWPSSYLHAAEIHAESGDRSLALIYGESFRALEPDSERSRDMAHLLAVVYRDLVIAKREQAETAAIGFEHRIASLLVEARVDGLSLQALHRARSDFLTTLPKGAGGRGVKGAPLFRWLQDLKYERHLEAYDYWLFAPAFLDEYRDWLTTHRAELDAFRQYAVERPLNERLR